MDRIKSNTTKRIQQLKKLIRVVVLMLILVVVLAGFRFFIQPSVRSSEVITSKVEKGDIQATLNANGTVLPAFEEILTSPISSQITQIYFRVGDHVSKGDSMLELDKESAIIELEKMEEELLVQRNRINQLKLMLEKKLIDLETSLKIKKLHTRSLEERLKEEQYMLELGGGTKEKLKQARLNLQISQIEMEQIKQTILNDQESMEADLQELRHQINIRKKNVRELRSMLRHAEVRAKNDGVITWIDNHIGKSVHPGARLVTIANLESFIAEGKISEIYADRLYSGQKVQLRVNDETDIYGSISGILPSIDNNIVCFNIALDKKSHPSLRPNMKVDVFVITDEEKNALRLTNGAFYRGGKEQHVFVLKGDKAIRKSVAFGKSNFNWIEIVHGLEEGDFVIVTDMSDYEHITEISIK